VKPPEGVTCVEKLFVITGASGGLGMSLLEEAAGRGHPVEAVSRSPIADLPAGSLPDGAAFMQMDCADFESVSAFWRSVRDRCPETTHVILINNAGKYLKQRFETIDVEAIEKNLSDNFLTSVNMTKGLLAHFERGTIVNLSSFAALHPRADLSIYCASKAALRSFYASLRDELPAGRFRILNLYPYRINTWSEEDEPGTIDRVEAARWIVDMALLDGSFEIADCTIVPFRVE
jgi:uncharacterized oxidoreductase